MPSSLLQSRASVSAGMALSLSTNAGRVHQGFVRWSARIRSLSLIRISGQRWMPIPRSSARKRRNVPFLVWFDRTVRTVCGSSSSTLIPSTARVPWSIDQRGRLGPEGSGAEEGRQAAERTSMGKEIRAARRMFRLRLGVERTESDDPDRQYKAGQVGRQIEIEKPAVHFAVVNYCFDRISGAM